jgi:hypothetical protein
VDPTRVLHPVSDGAAMQTTSQMSHRLALFCWEGGVVIN